MDDKDIRMDVLVPVILAVVVSAALIGYSMMQEGSEDTSDNQLPEGVFITRLFVNSGSEKVGAYDITVSYDSSVIKIASDIGDNGLEVGKDALDALEETPEPEKYFESLLAKVVLGNNGINFAGFNPYGIGPGDNMYLMNVYWEVKGSEGENTLLDLDVNTLVNEEASVISSPKGLSSRVTLLEDGVDVILEENAQSEVENPGSVWITS